MNFQRTVTVSKLVCLTVGGQSNRVVTMAGNVDSQEKRARIEKIAAAIPNVQQVVNELQVLGQKASSSK